MYQERRSRHPKGKLIFTVSLVVHRVIRVRAKWDHMKTFQGLLPQSQGQNLALTVLCVPYSLDSVTRWFSVVPLASRLPFRIFYCTKIAKSAAHRDKSREWNVSKQTPFNLRYQWITWAKKEVPLGLSFASICYLSLKKSSPFKNNLFTET